ncbi:MAG TPA: hypothetical protein VG186_18990 [Solirubrobacteraceae bacterium]|jgi:hypothetical protein|nr:hypothetical protein [Solirubrobacteraceae bacterium]
MLTGGLLALAGCGGSTHVVTKTVVATTPSTVATTPPPPATHTGPSQAAIAAAHSADAAAIATDAVQAASPLGSALFATAVAAATGATSSTTTSAPARRRSHHGGGAASGAPKRVVSGQGSGEYAVAYTNGTFHHPSQIVLNVSASPAQAGSVDWNIVCFELSGGIGRKEGRATLQLPTTKTLPLPAPSSTCIGSANVQLSKSGNVTISISG